MRLWRWLARGMTALVAVLLLAVVGVYAAGARKLSAEWELPVDQVRLDPEWADAERGARLAVVYGCTSCHGENLAGNVMVDSPLFGRIVAPNLTQVRESRSDADIVRVLRHGVRPDGTAVLPAMPAQAFTHLADEDIAALIAFLRSVPAAGGDLPDLEVALPLRAFLLAGALAMPADLIDHGAPRDVVVPRDDPVDFGRYLAHSACAECHGVDLRGSDRFMIAPHLAVAASYPLEDFRAFLRTGVALAGRELPTMSSIARRRLSSYTDEEIDALHAYLRAFASGGTSASAVR